MLHSLFYAHTLPFLPLSQSEINYCSQLRNEQDFTRVTTMPNTVCVLVYDGMVAVRSVRGGQTGIGIDTHSDVKHISTIPVDYARSTGLLDHAVAIYLGAHCLANRTQSATYPRVRETGEVFDSSLWQHYIALDVTNLLESHASFNALEHGADDDFDETTLNASLLNASLLACLRNLKWTDIRDFAPYTTALEAGLSATMCALSRWHERTPYCDVCARPMHATLTGWARVCDGKHTHFPRVEPAVITAIVDSSDRLLLQHNTAWADPLLYSVSAGFVEAGENLEHAAMREAYEEVGVSIQDITYVGSQPWPFPASLMAAFMAHTDDSDIHIDNQETNKARWVERDEYHILLAQGALHAPGKATIARYMIEQWLGKAIDL